MIIFISAITLLYLLLIGALLFGWNKVPETKLKALAPAKKFSVVVPYRNEAENLPSLLTSFSAVNYPEDDFELILVNDSSEDSSEAICQHFKQEHPDLDITLLNSKLTSNSPKKDAILTAIKHSKYEYILTTDADCIVQPTWLNAFNESLIETNAALVAGPVTFNPPPAGKTNKRYFHNFQEMDLMSLQAAGAGGFGLGKPFMCNGANLCYLKSAFYEVNGFEGNTHIASGDDVFLLQKFAESKQTTTYLKCREAIVYTQPQRDLKALISQRIRWAAKTTAYKSSFAKLLGLSVLLINFLLAAGAIAVLFQLIPYGPLMLVFLLKFNLDFALIYRATKFFDRTEILRNYFWSSLIYPFFSTWVAFLSLFKGYEWKGRRSRS